MIQQMNYHTIFGEKISTGVGTMYLRSCFSIFLKKQIMNPNYKFTDNELKDIETIKSLLRERE